MSKKVATCPACQSVFVLQGNSEEEQTKQEKKLKEKWKELEQVKAELKNRLISQEGEMFKQGYVKGYDDGEKNVKITLKDIREENRILLFKIEEMETHIKILETQKEQLLDPIIRNAAMATQNIIIHKN